MDDKHITTGLSMLADDLATPNIDIDAVIDTARLRNRRRRAVAAAALGTVTLVVAAGAVTTIGIGQNAPPPSVEAGASPTSTGVEIKGGGNEVTPVVDERARKLTAQLAAAKSDIIPAGMQVDPHPNKGNPPLEFVNRPAGGLDYYSAGAKLTDNQGWGTVDISVWRVSDRPGAESEMTCYAEGTNCVSTTFADGTKATLFYFIGTATGWNQNMRALRPDGTYISVSCDVFDTGHPTPGPTRPHIPLSTDQLFKFAPVFTY